MRVRTTSISYKQSTKFSPNYPLESYPISKTAFVFILLIGEEGANPRFNLTEDGDCEGDLGFITWIGELGVVDSPERSVELNQLLFTKQLLLFFLLHHQTFFSQGIPYPLIKFH